MYCYCSDYDRFFIKFKMWSEFFLDEFYEKVKKCFFYSYFSSYKCFFSMGSCVEVGGGSNFLQNSFICGFLYWNLQFSMLFMLDLWVWSFYYVYFMRLVDISFM